MTKIRSISLTDEEDAFLELLNLSPTGLLKQRIAQVKEDSDNFKQKVLEYEAKIKKYQDLLYEANQKLEKGGLIWFQKKDFKEL